jgi:FKBP-type peptidyl-prolyl cis-trans isomerase
MKTRHSLLLFISLFAVAACQQGAESPQQQEATAEQAVSAEEPKLKVRKTKNGYGRAAVAGDFVTVHYTGWLFDDNAPDNRGAKFDSSVDRGQHFQFPLGAGRVIKGWDQGVEGMLIGETRELIIPPELGYGDRGAGDAIPAGATLIFEVELFNAEGPE